jgi:hypothetical protein
MIRFLFLLNTYLLVAISCSAQNMVEYSSDYVFKDGLYISFQDFKNNNPIPITHILSDFDIRDPNYLDVILNQDSVVYYDNLFEERIIAVEDLWGFCKRNKVFIGFGEKSSYNNPAFFDFYSLMNIGAFSFFTAMESYYSTMSTSPTMGMGMEYRDPMLNNDITVTESEQVQLILQFSTGKILLAKRGDMSHLPADLVLQLIKPDGPLLTEFESLSVRDQKLKGMFFLRRYNERNPIYFPSN